MGGPLSRHLSRLGNHLGQKQRCGLVPYDGSLDKQEKPHDTSKSWKSHPGNDFLRELSLGTGSEKSIFITLHQHFLEEDPGRQEGKTSYFTFVFTSAVKGSDGWR